MTSTALTRLAILAYFAASMATAVAAERNALPDGFLLVSHRGVVADGLTENSLGALEEAIRRGYTHVEVDVRCTRDGQPVCLHDAGLHRAAGVKRYIEKTTLAQLRQLVPEATVPSFEAFCARSQGRIGLMPDLKACPQELEQTFLAHVEEALARHGLLDSALFIGRDPLTAHFQGKAKRAWGADLETTQALPMAKEEPGRYYFVFNHAVDFSQEAVDGFHALGLKIMVSVNTLHYRSGDAVQQGLDDTRAMLALGVDGLQIDSEYEPAVGLGARPAERMLKRSDVVFFIDDAKQYETYGCTVVGWGAHADAGHIQAAHDAGVRLLATSVPFRTGFAGVIDYTDDFLDAACRDFSGEPFIVPWLWDHTHKGQPMWWGCTNSPLYRAWLDTKLEKAMAAKPDGLHIDDYTGTAGAVTWLSGGFCKHCMQAFREYLKTKVSAEQLKELGIEDLDTFNYRQFLLDQGVKPEEYNRKRARLPLAKEFLDFQSHAVTDYVRQFHEQACTLRGRRVTLSVNSGLESPQALMIAPYVDFFCCEVNQAAPRGGWPQRPIYLYKLADALERPVAAMASGQDHAFVAEHQTSELLRTWIVTAYTHGQAFTAPTNLWCYTKEKGTHWYKGAPEDYAWLFRFVREHASLFDGYAAVAPVAVVYDNAARRAGRGNIERICTALDQANVPFGVVVAGDDWLDYRLTPEKLAPFKVLLVAEEPAHMDTAQRTLLEDSGRMTVYSEAVVGELPRITVENGRDVSAVLRVKPGDPAAPVVCHVHSRGYDAENDRVIPQADVVLHIPKAFLPDRAYGDATIYTPGAEDQKIPVETRDGKVLLRLPEAVLWHVVAF